MFAFVFQVSTLYFSRQKTNIKAKLVQPENHKPDHKVLKRSSDWHWVTILNNLIHLIHV